MSLHMCCAHTDRQISDLKEKQIFTQCDDLKTVHVHNLHSSLNYEDIKNGYTL